MNIRSSQKGYIAIIAIWLILFVFLSVLSGVAHSVADNTSKDESSPKQTTPSVTTTAPTTTTNTPPATEPPTVETPYDSLVYSEANKEFFIFLDAGHGWGDPGKFVQINENGEYDEENGVYVYEKDINFQITKKLKQALEKLGYTVGETRPGNTEADCPVELNKYGNFNAQDRPAYVNAQNPDYFVSIHCNAHDNPTSHGTRLFYSNKDSDNYKFLSKIKESLLQQMGIDTHDPFTDNLAITRESDMPTVLVESAFMTNMEDLQNLMDPKWQDQFACALALGIDAMVHS